MSWAYSKEVRTSQALRPELRVVGTDPLIVEIATNVIVDVLKDVL